MITNNTDNDVELSDKQLALLPYLLAVALFMQILDATILNTAIPKIGDALSVSPLKMQWAIISYVLTLAIFIPVSGYLSDRYGTKKIFISSLIIFGLGSIFCAISSTLPWLIVSRIIQALGGAMMTPVARLILVKSYPRKKLLTVMNYAVMPALVAPVIGPLIGGYIVEYFSWHWIFLINVPIAAIGIFLAFKVVPNFYEEVSGLDWVGFILFAGAACVLSFSMETLSMERTRLLAIGLAVLAFLLLFIYTKHARKHPNALFSMKLFDMRTFRVGIAASLATRLGISGIPYLLPLLLQLAHGYSPSQSGWIIAPMAVGSIAIKPYVSPIIRRMGYRRTLLINTSLIALLILVLAFVSGYRSWWVISPVLFLIGVCNSMQFSAMNTLTIGDLPRALTSSGNSLMATNQQLAIGMGITLGAAILNGLLAYLGEDRLLVSFEYTFILLSVFTFVAGLEFRKLHRNDGSGMY